MSPAFAVFLVLALLFGLLWLARRKSLTALSMRSVSFSGNSRANKQMRVIERLPLTPQHSLHLVTCAGRLLLVSASPGGCCTLADYAESAPEFVSAAGGAR